MVTFAAPPSHLWIRCYSAYQFCSKQLKKLSERPLKWSLAVSNLGRVDGTTIEFLSDIEVSKKRVGSI
jgi:hypothetical protein